MRHGFMVVAIVMFLVLQSASAVLVPGESERIDMRDCGFVTTGELSCGQSLIASCDIIDYTPSTLGITSVVYTIEGINYDAARNTGTTVNGSWAAVVEITEDFPAEVSFDVVYATNSRGDECTGSTDVEGSPPECYIEWNAERTITVDCECSWSTSEVRSPDDTCVITHTPNAGCEGEVAYETTSVCDYCDPEYVPSLEECIPNREEVDPFYGTALKRYISNNPSCCLETGLVSDCSFPVDANTEVVCRLDAWSGDGKNVFGGKLNVDQQLYENLYEVSQSFSVETVNSVLGAGQNEKALKPVAFDFDYDGEMEMVYFKANGFIVYRIDFTEEQVVSNAGVAWQGQPGLFGFNELYNRVTPLDDPLGKTWLWSGDNYNQAGLCVQYEGQLAPNECTLCGAQPIPYAEQLCCNVNPECVWDASLPSPTDLGRGFAGIVRDSSGDDHFVAYQSIGGTFAKLTDINLWATESTLAPGAGVSCWLDYCYFADQNQFMWKVDVDGGTYTRMNLDHTAALNVQTNPLDTVPVFVQSSDDGLVTGVVVETWSSVGSPGPALSVCDINLASGCNMILVGPSANASISRLIAEPYNNNIEFSYGTIAGTPIVFVLWDDFYNDGSVLENYLYTMVVDTVPPGIDPWESAGFKQLEGTGGAASCVTDPALARCSASGNLGIAVAPHFEQASSSLVTLPEYPWYFNENSNVASPLQEENSAVVNDAARSICSGDLCVMLSGVNIISPTLAPWYDYNQVNIYKSVDGGPWSAVSKPAGFLDGSTFSVPGGFSAECTPLIRYVGGMNGVVYFVTAEVDVCGPDYPTRKTTYIDDYAIWKLTGDGVISEIGEFSDQGQYPEGIVQTIQEMGEPMQCSSERCWVSITRGDGSRLDLFEIKADETWDSNRPSALVSIGPYTDLSIDTGAPSFTSWVDDGTGDIYGYAKTSLAWYYAIGSSRPRGSGSASWPGFLVRVPYADPAAYSVIASNSYDHATYIGLHADESVADTVWYGWMMNSLDGFWNSTSGLLGDVAILDTGWDKFLSNGTEFGGLASSSNCWNTVPYDTRRHYKEGQWRVYKVENGGSPDAELQQTVKIKGSTWCEPCTSPSCWELPFGVDRSAPMVGGVDGGGDHYVQFTWVGVTPWSDGSSQRGYNSDHSYFDADEEPWLIVMSENRIFSPVMVEKPIRSNAIPREESFPLCVVYDEECIDGTCCWPMEVDNIGSGLRGAAYPMSSYNFGTVLRKNTASVSYFDKLTSGGSVTVGGDYTYYSCYEHNYGSVVNGFTEKVQLTVPETICPSSIATIDVDADGIDEILSISGLYKYGAGQLLDPSIAATSPGVVASFDMNADTYIDFSLVSTQLLHVVSSPEISVAKGIDGEGTSVESCVASFEDITGRVSVVPTGVVAENPGWLTYTAELLNPDSLVVVDRVSQNTPNIWLSPLVGGQYDVDYFVLDELKFAQCGGDPDCRDLAQGAVTCTVVVPQDVFVPPVSTSSCSLEPDGEFNFPEIMSTDWLLGTASSIPSMVAGSYVNLDGQVSMIHEVLCSDEGLGMTVMIRGDATGDTSIFVEALSTVNGLAYQVGGLRLYGLEVQAYGESGSTSVVTLVPEALGEWIEVYLEFDFINQEYTVSVDDVEYVTLPFANDAQGKVISVVVHNDVGTTDIDYIRTEALTGLVRDTRSEIDQGRAYAFQAITTCINASDRDWGENPAGEYQVYPNVQLYCDRVNEGDDETYCTDIQLLDAIHYNPGCYWEANNYCQYITFPITGGMRDDDVSVKGGAGTLSGVMACTALLGTGATWTLVAEPSINVFWNLITDNMLVFVLLLTAVVVAIPFIARRKR